MPPNIKPKFSLQIWFENLEIDIFTLKTRLEVKKSWTKGQINPLNGNTYNESYALFDMGTESVNLTSLLQIEKAINEVKILGICNTPRRIVLSSTLSSKSISFLFDKRVIKFLCDLDGELNIRII